MSSGDEHIERIRTALWSRPFQHGASVMVGSGFSRNAVPIRPDASPLALWSDLMSRMEERLNYPRSSGRGTSDALRLASQYQSAFGSTALEELLREAIPDDQYEPGPLHKSLMRLPWADVFTTNYDRLLERVPIVGNESNYSVVRTSADIPNSARPRIVKLHGSFPSHRPFIITEEHYRTYPRDFAPFINAVQQAVMETTFCLVGFSGDDPNFLQWSGWVRDNLGDTAPPIYLCGVLDLTAAQQHLLQSRRIIPVDLGTRFPIASYPNPDLRKAHALEWLLWSLRLGEPTDLRDWPQPPEAPATPKMGGLSAPLPRKDVPRKISAPRPLTFRAPLDAAGIGRAVAAWYSDRCWCPNWRTLPEPNRRALWGATDDWIFAADQWITAIASFSPAEQILAWYELLWRVDRSLVPLTSQLADALAKSLDLVNPYPDHLRMPGGTMTPGDPLSPSEAWPPEGPSLDWDRVSTAWVELAFMLARNAREEFDEVAFAHWTERLAMIAELRPEWLQRLHYENATRHLFLLDQRQLEAALESWEPNTSLPYWRAKRAALLAEVGDHAGARSELSASLLSVQTGAASGRPSFRAMSEEGWLLWLSTILHETAWRNPADRHDTNEPPERRRRLDQLAVFRCDPSEHLADRRRGLQEADLRRYTDNVEPNDFDPGHRSRTKRFGMAQPNAWFVLRTFECGVLPIRTSQTTIFSDAVKLSARELFFNGDYRMAISVLLRLGDDKAIEEIFSRTLVAVLPQGQIDVLYTWLARVLREAIVATQVTPARRNGFLSRRLLRPCSQAISRLLFRLQGEYRDDARRLLQDFYCARCVRDDRSGLSSEVRRMLRRGCFSLSSQEIVNFLPHLLALPIPEVHGFAVTDVGDWPEPFDELNLASNLRLASPEARGDCETQVTHLLHCALLRGEPRWRSIRRLVALHDIGALTHEEAARFGVALWSQLDDRGIPSGTTLLDHAFLSLPHPPSVDVRRLVQDALLAATIPKVIAVVDGRHAISSLDVRKAQMHLRTLEWVSATRLNERDEKERIRWSPSEAEHLLTSLESWADTIGGWKSAIGPAYSAAIALTARVLVPSLFEVPNAVKRCMLLLSRFEASGSHPLESSPIALIADPESVKSIIEPIRRGFHVPDPAEPDSRRKAAAAVYLWLAYASAGLVEAPPADLFIEIATSLVVQGRPGLEEGLELMTVCLEKFPTVLNAVIEDLLVRAVSYAELSSRLPSAVQLLQEPNVLTAHLPALRAAVAGLAAQLARHFAMTGRAVPETLAELRAKGTSDVLPEVRREWDN